MEEEEYLPPYEPPGELVKEPKILVEAVEWSKYDKATGLIRGHYSSSRGTALVNDNEEFGVWLGEHVDGFTHYINVAASPLAVTARPTVPVPPPGPAPWTWDLTTIPAGAVLTLRNEVGDELEITDLSEVLTLTDAGTYQVTLQPPAPYVPLSFELEVSDA